MALPFRFGLLIETRSIKRNELLEMARRADAEGYSIVLGTDHLGRLSSAQLVQAAAEVTSLRVGTLVLNNDLRHPAVLAQELATLDVVTEGRLEIGLGAGWARDEYDGAQISFDRPGRRLARLAATVEILRQSLSEGRIDRPADDAYPAMRLDNMPVSVQRPYPPLLIGGGGPRLLAYAARNADMIGLDPRALPEGGHDPADITDARITEKIGWIREAAPDRWPQLEINLIIFGVDPEFGRRSGPSPVLRHPIGEDEMARSPHYLVGSTDQMVEQLVERRERLGINYLAVRTPDLDLMAPIVGRLAGR